MVKLLDELCFTARELLAGGTRGSCNGPAFPGVFLTGPRYATTPFTRGASHFNNVKTGINT